MLINTLFNGVPMGLKNLGNISDVGVQALDDFASLDLSLGDLCPDGVGTSGVAGIDINSDLSPASRPEHSSPLRSHFPVLDHLKL